MKRSESMYANICNVFSFRNMQFILATFVFLFHHCIRYNIILIVDHLNSNEIETL